MALGAVPDPAAACPATALEEVDERVGAVGRHRASPPARLRTECASPGCGPSSSRRQDRAGIGRDSRGRFGAARSAARPRSTSGSPRPRAAKRCGAEARRRRAIREPAGRRGSQTPDRPASDLVLISGGRCRGRWCRAFLSPRRSSRGRGRARRAKARSMQHCQRALGSAGVTSTPLARDRVDFVEQRPGIDDDAVADDRQFCRAARPPEGSRLSLYSTLPMTTVWPGIVTALKADDYIGPLRQPIDDLSFALVAPLGRRRRRHCPFSRLL